LPPLLKVVAAGPLPEITVRGLGGTSANVQADDEIDGPAGCALDVAGAQLSGNALNPVAGPQVAVRSGRL
jgi:hypothetical protein